MTFNSNKRSLKLRRSALVVLFSLSAICASVINGQAQGMAEVPNDPLPHVKAVNGRLEVGQTVSVVVDNLSDWAATHDPRKLLLYFDGRALSGIYPEEVYLSENRLTYHLQRTPESNKEWQNLFHEPVFIRPVALTVGLDGQSQFATDFDYNNPLPLTVIPKTWGVISLITFLGLLTLLVVLATRTDILRDPRPSVGQGEYRPYDLGRVQTAFWFFIISSSYVWIWLITGDLESLTPAAFGLMAINAATVLGPRLIDLTGTETGQTMVARESLLNGLPAKGFFTDILSDAYGYSFHRFQMVLWTLLLGVMFLYFVYDNFAMPNFTRPLLGLMGISSGTYVAFELLNSRSRQNIRVTDTTVNT